jgi:gamma-glutamylcyclotransferase (GGCT)/AIG2-like uncharacterized protein YtfP
MQKLPKHLFIYGTLAHEEVQKEVSLTYEFISQYDYIKGYALKEIYYEGYGTYLSAYKCEDGIISGRVLFNANLDECINNLNEYEGEQYELVEITTCLGRLECAFYCEKTINNL